MKPDSLGVINGDKENTELAVLKVMLVYEDTDAGLRAKLALEHLPRELKLAEGCSITFWRQDLLSLPWLREQAALEASVADVIIVSIDEKAEIPEEIKDWLNRWMHHKGSDACALGILVNEQSLREWEVCPTVTYFRKIAQTAKAIFFAVLQTSSRSSYGNGAPVHSRNWAPPASDYSGEEALVPISH